MPECPLSLCEAIEKLRKERKVPIGIVVFDIESESLSLYLLPDVRDMAEANALLAQVGIKVET